MTEFDSIGRFGLLVDEIAETMLGLLQQIIRRRARAVHRPIAGRPHLQPGTTPAGVQSMRKSAQIGLCAIVLALAGVTAAAAQSLWLSPGGPGIVRLAERGDARAQTRIGFMYATGQRVPQNPIEAAYWYRRAAEQGDINAQYLLGVCYDNGRGVPRDLVQAHKWMNLSASLSTGEEREHRVRMRDIIGVKMSYQQIAQARDLALTWRPQRER
jgi:TPR repeat protein